MSNPSSTTTQKSFNVFEFVNSINDKKNYPEIIEEHEKEYTPFIVNKSFSFFQDSIFFSNAMNQHAGNLDNQQQFEFYYHALSKRRRYSKWLRKQSAEATEQQIVLVINKYSCSRRKAKELLAIFAGNEEKKNNYIESLIREGYKGGNKQKQPK